MRIQFAQQAEGIVHGGILRENSAVGVKEEIAIPIKLDSAHHQCYKHRVAVLLEKDGIGLIVFILNTIHYFVVLIGYIPSGI